MVTFLDFMNARKKTPMSLEEGADLEKAWLNRWPLKARKNPKASFEKLASRRVTWEGKS
jgi:hypothetical protein